MEGNWIFALDIGTRTVVGLIAQKLKDDSLKVMDLEVTEHPSRSMVGGQIHDVPQVAKTIAQLKKQLETKLGFQLKGAAVAAAGRSLLTTFGKAEMTFPYPQEVSEEIYYALQLEAVRHAQHRIREMDKSLDYHCVGFTVVHQYLDQEGIGNLVGQIGKQIEVQIIATFLPRMVIDSLHTALQKAGLDMEYITLEPIAALNLAVPDNMRQLNIALVDIGAGTSDIAISEGGTVRGYGMVPVAGDQITDIICQTYLVEFMTGENIKRQLSGDRNTVSFSDITGTHCCLPVENVLETIGEAVTSLAQKIAEKILEVNGRAPQAILCIGGGSLTPGLTKELASILSLPENRVAVIGSQITEPLTRLTQDLSSPEAVTPLAIAADALYHRSLSIVKVSVNHRPVRLFAANELTVGDALVAAGIPPSQYLGRIGPAISVEVNGEIVFIKGKPGQMGKVKVNDQAGELTTIIHDGDNIIFEPGTTGKPGQGSIKDILPEELLNKKITVRLNNQPVDDYEQPLKDGDKIEFTLAEEIQVSEVSTPSTSSTSLTSSTPPTGYLQVILNGKTVELPLPEKGGNPILTDLLNVVDFDLKTAKGKKLVMEVNGEPASFITPLKEGDNINLRLTNQE
ncbi:MAG: hypothetical protein GX750_09635 [Clostridia bacterium]|nr:hypothetical protein [Clostridia bacterium]